MLFFDIYGTTPRTEPEILFTPADYEKIGDDPSAHRWRAAWLRGFGHRQLDGIELQAYPVLRKTECGAWIDPYAYRTATKQPWEEGAPGYEWATDERTKRWVSDDGARAWAKPTQEEALYSLAVRLQKWADFMDRDVRKIKEAVDIAERLLDAPSRVSAARRTIDAIGKP